MDADVQHVRPTGPFTVFRAVALKAELLARLEEGRGEMVLDLSAVPEIDTAGVQLLLMLEREARRRSRSLSLQGASASVQDTLDLLGLRPALRHGATPSHRLVPDAGDE